MHRGGVTWRHGSLLVVIDGNMTICRDIDVFKPTLIPFLQNLDDIPIFQQDNARPHSVRLTREFFHRNNVNVLPLPAFLLDLSPIEHLWDQLGHHVYDSRRRINNHEQLMQALTAKWEVIPQYQIQCLIRSMRC